MPEELLEPTDAARSGAPTDLAWASNRELVDELQRRVQAMVLIYELPPPDRANRDPDGQPFRILTCGSVVHRRGLAAMAARITLIQEVRAAGFILDEDEDEDDV